MKKLKKILIGSFILFIIISSCTIVGDSRRDGEDVDMKDPSLSIVLGYIDMSDAPSEINWLQIRQYRPKPQRNRNSEIDEKMFYHLGIPKGSFQVAQFGYTPKVTFGNTVTTYTYSFTSEGKNPSAIRIKIPGVYYLGSYKYKPYKHSKYIMEILKTPSEKDLLNTLLKNVLLKNKEKYALKIKMVRNRLKEL
ncbi:MAG: hypothetical protein OEV44_04735 [Spirochaetota bacterium]|nr:hypothetical protein [Spirochaetota bacterium]